MLSTLSRIFAVEFRQHRANFFGLIAGLFLVILAIGQWQGGQYLSDPHASLWFAGFGYLGCIFTIGPFVLRAPAKDPQRAFLARNPDGLSNAFFGKLLYWLFAMLACGMAPAVMASTVGAIQTQYGFLELLTGTVTWQSHLLTYLASVSLPLALLGWGLPVRWAWWVGPLALGLTYGIFNLEAKASYPPDIRLDSVYFAILFPLSILLFSWSCAWLGFALAPGTRPLRRSLLACLVAWLSLSPAWGLGVIQWGGYAFWTTSMDSSASTFRMSRSYLSADGQSVYSQASDGKGGHVIRIDLRTGELKDYGAGTLNPWMQGHWGWLDARKLIGYEQLLFSTPSLLQPWTRERSPMRVLQTASGEFETANFAPKDDTLFPTRKDVGLEQGWFGLRIGGTNGEIFYRRSFKEGVPTQKEWALYESTRGLVQGEDLPIQDLGNIANSLHLGPGLWLFGPGPSLPHWETYDPDTKQFTVASGLLATDESIASIQDGRVLMHRAGRVFLYDPSNARLTFMTGDPVDLVGNESISQPLLAAYADAADPCLLLVRDQSGAARLGTCHLGWVDLETGSIRWHTWSRYRTIVGKLDDTSILVNDQHRSFVKLDLETGESTVLYPKE